MFELYERYCNGSVFKVKYRGVWHLVDNGYLNWASTVPPMKTTMYRNETRWSEWIESVRKGVECTFGIMKDRWIILKAGIRVHGVNSTDKIGMTCCALHNLLIDVDSLSEEWNEELGLYDKEDGPGENRPFALQRL